MAPLLAISNVQALEAVFEETCENGSIPGAVLAAINSTGTFQYEKAFGIQSLERGKNTPLTAGTLLSWLWLVALR